MAKPVQKLATKTLQVVERSIDGPIPYARNARTHSPEQVAQIAGSIREYGWTNPVLVAADGTIIACEMTGRSCHAVELNPAYVDMAVRRWQVFATGKAVLASTGEAFDDLAQSRGQQ